MVQRFPRFILFSGSGQPVNYVQPPAGIGMEGQRRLIDTVSQLNRHRLKTTYDPEIETRLATYEMAFRMQTSVPELADFSDEEVSFLLREAMQAGLKELSMILVAERTRRRNQKSSKHYNL